MKKRIMLLLVALLILAWFQTVSRIVNKPAEIREHIELAQAYEEKEIYESALQEYEQALQIDPQNAELQIKTAELQLILGNESSFITICKGLINEKNVNEDALQKLIDYYVSDGKTNEAVRLLKSLHNGEIESEKAEELWLKYQGSFYELYYSWQNITSYHNGYAVVSNGEVCGLIDEEGKIVLEPEYTDLGYYSGEHGCVAANVDGQYVYINEDGNKKFVPEESVEQIGVWSEGFALAVKDGKYGYLDESMQNITAFTWENASNIYKNAGAVCIDGKWMLIDENFEQITDATYEDVILDDMGYCSRQKRIFAKTENGYILLDNKGEQISEETFDMARAFEDSELTAVCRDGKWGYIDRAGVIQIDFCYEDARTFANGYAPVCLDGKWGYIDTDGNIAITPQFEDAYPFNEAGTAPVKKEEWILIKLYALQ